MILGDTQKEHELQQKEKTQGQGDIANTKKIQATLQDSKAMDNVNVHTANANIKLQKQVKIQKYYFKMQIRSVQSVCSKHFVNKKKD